jgi:hypothetical protein
LQAQRHITDGSTRGGSGGFQTIASGTIVALTEERVSDMTSDSMNDQISHFQKVKFQTPSGREVKFQSQMGSGRKAGRIGRTVAVRYRPDQPDVAEIDSFMSLWGCNSGVRGGGRWVPICRSWDDPCWVVLSIQRVQPMTQFQTRRLTARSTGPPNSVAVGYPRRFAPRRLVSAIVMQLTVTLAFKLQRRNELIEQRSDSTIHRGGICPPG